VTATATTKTTGTSSTSTAKATVYVTKAVSAARTVPLAVTATTAATC
jgi:hypothetical protein